MKIAAHEPGRSGDGSAEGHGAASQSQRHWISQQLTRPDSADGFYWKVMWVKQCHKPSPSYHHVYGCFFDDSQIRLVYVFSPHSWVWWVWWVWWVSLYFLRTHSDPYRIAVSFFLYARSQGFGVEAALPLPVAKWFRALLFHWAYRILY